jgi:hypothetical protein
VKRSNLKILTAFSRPEVGSIAFAINPLMAFIPRLRRLPEHCSGFPYLIVFIGEYLINMKVKTQSLQAYLTNSYYICFAYFFTNFSQPFANFSQPFAKQKVAGHWHGSEK